VLLDINLPHHNGYYWCSQIRAHSNVPIIFISSLSDKMDQMMAIQMDGDDYLKKPIDLQLTVAKIQALLRRTYDFQMTQSQGLSFYGVQMDRQKAAISYQNKKTSLTYTELQILSCLFEHGEEYAKREEILDYCWQNDQFIDNNTLAVNISCLRKKLKEIGLDNFIETKKKVGYRLAKEAVQDQDVERIFKTTYAYDWAGVKCLSDFCDCFWAFSNGLGDLLDQCGSYFMLISCGSYLP